jgi:hypothetical protein
LIVVDSSVWVALLRGTETWAVRTLRDRAGRDRIAIGDLILAEVLQGARDEAHATWLERQLRRNLVVGMVDDALAVQAARNDRTLRAAGITPRRTIDVLIGTFCLSRRCALLHDDRDFDAMERVLGLEVV